MPLCNARKLAGAAAIAALAPLAPSGAYAQAADAAAAVSACQHVPGRSARLECYDRAFPPIVEPASPQVEAAPRESNAAPSGEQSASVGRERRNATLRKSAAAFADHARIVDVQTPSVATTLLVAADGRVFVRTNSATVVKWPDAPFEVDIEKSWLGNSLYLVHPRTAERVRVGVRE